MLNGIGGRTVAEAKDNMLVSEFNQWVKYRNTRGTLSTPRRLEQTVARLCHMVCVAAGIKKDKDMDIAFTMLDFMPHEDGYKEAQEEPSFDDFVAKAISQGDLK